MLAMRAERSGRWAWLRRLIIGPDDNNSMRERIDRANVRQTEESRQMGQDVRRVAQEDDPIGTIVRNMRAARRERR